MSVQGKPKLISNHAWAKHQKLTQKLKARNGTWLMKKN
jgi:hypothetical protein